MPEIIFQNTLSSPTIAAADSGQYKLLYSPGTKNGIPLDGFISDFRCFATIRSVQELVNAKPVPTTEKPYYSESEIEQYEYNLLGGSNYKSLQIHTSQGLAGEKSYKFSLPIFNRKPHIEIDIHSRFTKNTLLQVPTSFCFWGKIDNLATGDNLSFWVSAYEEGLLDFSDIGRLNETFYTLNLQAGIITSFPFPDNTQGFSFKCRGDSPQSGIAWGWKEPDLVANYDYLPAFSEESAWIFPSENKSLFLKADSSCILIVKLWNK